MTFANGVRWARGASCLAGLVLAAQVAAQDEPPAARAALRLPNATAPARDVYPTAPPMVGRAIRVGLRPVESGVKLGSSRGALRLYRPGSTELLWPERADGAVLIVPEDGTAVTTAPVRRVQIGSFRDRARAEALARQLEAEFHAITSAAWDPDRNVWRVRLGEADDPEGLGELLRAVRAGGYPDAWIVSEPRARVVDGRMRLIDSRWNVLPVSLDRLLLLPAEGERLTVEGKEYRGLIEARVSPSGAVQLINELPLEDYLRGVVPLELGPALFPEIDAQKAQAIAARTYALANLGQFLAEGFDVCDGPRCQVYGGAAAEHPLSDRAIRETAGQVLAWDGAPINALFTATCGGHTEDVEQVFPEWHGIYLRGVPCFAEDRELERVMVRIVGAPLPSAISEEPAEGALVLSRAASVAAGVLPEAVEEAAFRAGPASAAELSTWGARLAQRAGRPAPPALEQLPDRITLWRWLALFTGAAADAAQALLAGDERMLVMSADRALVPSADWPLIAELLERGLPLVDQTGRLRPNDPPTRGEAAALIARLGDDYGAHGLTEATVLAPRADGVRLRVGKQERTLRIGTTPLLVAESAAGWYRVAELALLPGDKLVIVTAGDSLRLVGVKRRLGRGDDRRGTNYRWTEVRDARALADSLGKVAPVGRLRELTIVRRGVSGRVAQLAIEGSSGRALIEGFRIRRALDLPEILFTMSVQKDAEGFVQRVVFRGRGWGHGVGMCQSGAFGMAQRGREYTEILAHYYPGARLVDAR